MLRLVPERILDAKNLNIGDKTVIDVTLDKRGWFAAVLQFVISVVIGTGTGAKSESELLFFKNISFETDLDKESHNAPARPLYRFAQFMQQVAPAKDAMAAATADYRVQVPLFWGDPLSRDPHHTMLDNRRYEQAQVVVNCGTVADLFTTPGTAAITAKLEKATALKTNFDLPAGWAPKFYRYFKSLSAVDHTDLEQKIRRVPDLRTQRLLYMLATSATAGVPFSGTPVDAGITDVSFDTGRQKEMDSLSRRYIADDNTRYYKLASRPTGWYMLDFMPEGDPEEALIMHPDVLTAANMEWDTDDATATTVNTLLDGAQTLKV